MKYELKYLPLALQDLNEIIDYIDTILRNRKAAIDFINLFDVSVKRLQEFPYSCRIYKSQELLDSEYRVLPGKNYLVFYVVEDDSVEIRRVIYERINYEKLI